MGFLKHDFLHENDSSLVNVSLIVSVLEKDKPHATPKRQQMSSALQSVLADITNDKKYNNPV